MSLCGIKFYGGAYDLEAARVAAGVPELDMDNRVPVDKDEYYEVRVTMEDAMKLVSAFCDLPFYANRPRRLFTLTAPLVGVTASYRHVDA